MVERQASVSLNSMCSGDAGLQLSISVQKEPPAEPGALEKDRTGLLPVVRASALEVTAPGAKPG
jgi:hypothetical protein